MATGFDPEAEQEVDFARYVRMLARRWWLVLIGVVVGAVIGYLVSLGGAKLYNATATPGTCRTVASNADGTDATLPASSDETWNAVRPTITASVPL